MHWFCCLSQIKEFRKCQPSNGGMDVYCVLLVDRAGHVLGVDEIDAANDQQAIDHAHKRYACGSGKGYEIWRDNRRVQTFFESRLAHH
jgi:hypothetical protein